MGRRALKHSRVAGWLSAAGALALAAAAAAQPGLSTDPSTCARFERVVAVAAINATRSQGGRCGSLGERSATGALRWNADLAEVAQAQARWLAERGELLHTGRDGASLAQRARSAGYAFRRIAENLALGQKTPEEAVADWLASESHCVNLLDAAVDEIGLGAACTAQAEIVWVMVAGRR